MLSHCYYKSIAFVFSPTRILLLCRVVHSHVVVVLCRVVHSHVVVVLCRVVQQEHNLVRSSPNTHTQRQGRVRWFTHTPRPLTHVSRIVLSAHPDDAYNRDDNNDDASVHRKF